MVRVCGSHYRLGKGKKRVTVPVHGSRDLGKGLLAAITRQSEVKLKLNIQYPAKIVQDATKRYLVTFPDLPEAFTEGTTKKEALAHAIEALTLTLEGRLDEGVPVPKPSVCRKAHMITPFAKLQAALLVHFSKGRKSHKEINRVLKDPHRWPSLSQLDHIAQILGKRLVISLGPLAR